MTQPSIRVSVFSAHRLAAQVIAVRLRRAAGVHVVACCTSADGFPETPSDEPVELAVLDASAHAIDCVEQMRRLRLVHPGLSIVVFGVEGEEAEIVELIEAGARGFVPKSAGVNDLFEVIESVWRGTPRCPPALAAKLYARLAELARSERRGQVSAISRLTTREAQVFAFLSAGHANKQIAAELGLSVSTVKSHVHKVLAKLQARGRGEVRRGRGTPTFIRGAAQARSVAAPGGFEATAGPREPAGTTNRSPRSRSSLNLSVH